MMPVDRAALLAAGFTEEPEPIYLSLRAERAKNQPADLADLGLVRVRFRTRWGGWMYVCIPESAVVG